MKTDMNKPSEGLGDTIAKVTHFFGIDTLAEAVSKLAGVEDCGCSERKIMLNELFPYEDKVRKVLVLEEFMLGPNKYFKGEELEVKKGDPLYHRFIASAQEGKIKEIE